MIQVSNSDIHTLKMASLQHGVLIAKIVTFGYNLVGFYFTPMDGPSKCLFLDPSINKSERMFLLDDILRSGAFSEIWYRELTHSADVRRFKLALVNMQSSFDSNDLEIAVRNDITGNMLANYASAHIDYIVKAVGQNPAERLSQCTSMCYAGPVSSIKSYDPFGVPKLYHRNVPEISQEDRIRLKGWSDFFIKSCSASIVSTPVNITNNNSIPADTFFDAFLEYMIDDGSAAEDISPISLPLSLLPPKTQANSIESSLENIIITWGLNIYDGACWEIALWLLKNSNSTLLDSIRSTRKTTQLGSIIGNNVNSKQANAYPAPLIISENVIPVGPVDPTHRETVYPYDPNGYAFGTISNYYNFDPITLKPQLWSDESIHWNNFNPTTKENAWFYGIAPFIRNDNHMNFGYIIESNNDKNIVYAGLSEFKGYPGFISTLYHMMDSNGGFYHSPRNKADNTYKLLAEDNLSMYGTLSHLRAHLHANPNIQLGIKDGQIVTMMGGIIRYFTTLMNKKEYFFYNGKIWADQRWVIDDRMLVNVQTWAICALQPEMIDRIFGEVGAALKMWNHLKHSHGYYHQGKLCGFGYIPLVDGISSGSNTEFGVKSAIFESTPKSEPIIITEMTFAAMLAGRVLQTYYGNLADNEPYFVGKDLSEIEEYIYTPNTGLIEDHHLLHVTSEMAYFDQASNKVKNEFGRSLNSIPSTAATAWHIFYTKRFNPFIPKGALIK